MTAPEPLPGHLRADGFTRADAEAAGLRAGRLRRRDLARPFHGVRSARVPEDVLARCRAYTALLKPGQFFSHATAALLLGLPLPSALADDEVVHVAAVRPADAPHRRGVVGHRLVVAAAPVEQGGLPVSDHLDVLCQLGASLGLEDLVVVVDHLLNTTSAGVEDAKAAMLARIRACRRIGGARLEKAVAAGRRGSRSPAETRVRLVLTAAGLPEPELNARIVAADGRYLGSPDLVWRDLRVVLEYEGDQHRADRSQWRYDVLRYDELAAEGWRVVRVTGDDLTLDGRRRLVQRVRRALAG